METYVQNEKQKHTYKIKNGISKIKGGIMVLKDLGYPEEIVKNAFNNMKTL
jgi:DNA mismatch repair ATPase MutS